MMMTMLVLSLLLGSASSLGARVIYVDQSGGGDVATIQKGLNVAEDGDTVRVMEGVYREEDISFLGKVVQLESVNGPLSTTVLAVAGYHDDAFQFVSGEDERSILEGFTITGSGTGITCNNSSSPTIQNNIIKNCGSGGGIYIYNGRSPVVRGNLIIDNAQEGIYVERPSSPTIEGNLLYGNGDWAIYSPNDNAPIIRDNVVLWNGRGIYAGSAPEVSGNLVAFNESGISYGKDVTNNVILNNVTAGIVDGAIANSVKSHNVIVGHSDGIAVYLGLAEEIRNNVVVGCDRGIVVYGHLEPPVARNNILVENGWGVFCYAGEQIDLSYNDAWGNTLGDYHNCTPGEGSLSLDPGFVDPGRNHYALSAASPLIDLGDPAILDPDSTRSDMGAYGGPDALSFALTLIPRDTVLTRGADSLLYEVILSNTTGLTQQVQAWTKLILASRMAYPGNPVVGPVLLELGPHETMTLPRPIVHPIPPNAPAGIYEYRVDVGPAPGEVLAERNFFFLVQP